MAGYRVRTNGEFPLMSHPYTDYLRNQMISYVNGDGVRYFTTSYDVLLKTMDEIEKAAEAPLSLETKMLDLGIKREF